MSAKFKVYLAFGLWVTLGWILFSCFIEPRQVIDPKLRYYYDNFNKIVKENCKNPSKIDNPSRIKIEFVDYIGKSADGHLIIGQCHLGFFKYRLIINKNWYEMSNLIERYNLLFHELGHCALKLGHVDNPNNFMFPEIIILPYAVLKQQVINEIKVICK